jgi:hypothetical protein
MSSLHISDFTFAGAYVSAVTAAHESDRRNAERHSKLSEGPSRLKPLSTLVRRIVIAIVEKRSIAFRLASPRV